MRNSKEIGCAFNRELSTTSLEREEPPVTHAAIPGRKTSHLVIQRTELQELS
jgi:hypothetical protein